MQCSARAADASLDPLLWQRGLSLYYTRDFQQSADQFRRDVAANPNDTEEAIWAFLAEAQIIGAPQARAQFLKVRSRRVSRKLPWESLCRSLGAPAALHLLFDRSA